METRMSTIPLFSIDPDINQPRKDFEEEPLEDLASSISAVGVVQPITVRESEGGRYVIIAGERRWRASKLAGKQDIPCIVRSKDSALTNDDIYNIQLTENLHRKDLNPVEKAEFIQERLDKLKDSGIDAPGKVLAEELGVSTAWISKNTAVLKYSDEVRALARTGKIRDYSIISKVEKLKGEKKKRALSLIDSGEFVAKEFFARKRYEKKNVASEGENPGKERTPAEASFSLKVTKSEWICLIEKTEYRYILNNGNPNWKESSDNEFKKIIGTFKDWFLSDS